MSDLDADLYGDLYETEVFEQPAEAEKAPAETGAQPGSSSSKTEPTTSRIPTVDISSSSSFAGQQSVQTPIAPATQSIPTFEEPVQSDYRDHGAYQSISVAERSVRPSEMKDEG
ncbi:hypothetical protein C8J56DRAFT_398461 [Mycena floridula]|nr:hypothetical protein C8J56DRAFT_398461 [Mycena floridula]